jgi:predicted PhzF superfamily epimerase YddE/YHI9
MLDLEYRHVDVFSRRALRGNGLVVVLNAASLPAAVMQDVTREVRQFETAFLTDVDLTGGSARLRIFTEDEELDFAGHPVLGAAAVLHTLLPVSGAEHTWALAVAQRTVAARTRGAAGWIDATMDQGVPHVGPAIAGKPGRAYSDALNLAPGQLHPALPMQVVSTGLPYLIVPVQDRLEGRTWDNAGRIEDVATGSAAGPAAGYLMHHGVRAPRRAPADPPGPVHRAAQHHRDPPRSGRPAMGRRAGGAGRQRTIPRPPDLTAAPARTCIFMFPAALASRLANETGSVRRCCTDCAGVHKHAAYPPR